MKDFSNTSVVSAEVKRILAEEPDSGLVKEAQARVDFLTENPLYPGHKGSLLTELANVIWIHAGMPFHPSEKIDEGYLYSTNDIAERIGVNTSRIRQLAPEVQKSGFARKVGRDWEFKAGAIQWVRDRQNGRGRPKQGCELAEPCK
ncbi:MAG: hypothetical protein GY797_23130 [Deltaproteobacteria bacterium]|nr:hypothetical protein [Deltaproteobacteria bacterium]